MGRDSLILHSIYDKNKVIMHPGGPRCSVGLTMHITRVPCSYLSSTCSQDQGSWQVQQHWQVKFTRDNRCPASQPRSRQDIKHDTRIHTPTPQEESSSPFPQTQRSKREEGREEGTERMSWGGLLGELCLWLQGWAHRATASACTHSRTTCTQTAAQPARGTNPTLKRLEPVTLFQKIPESLMGHWSSTARPWPGPPGGHCSCVTRIGGCRGWVPEGPGVKGTPTLPLPCPALPSSLPCPENMTLVCHFMGTPPWYDWWFGKQLNSGAHSLWVGLCPWGRGAS